MGIQYLDSLFFNDIAPYAYFDMFRTELKCRVSQDLFSQASRQLLIGKQVQSSGAAILATTT
jgi:hypothetical protein